MEQKEKKENKNQNFNLKVYSKLREDVLHNDGRVLVTGAAGFVGNKLIQRLVGNGIPVVATDVLESREFEYLYPLVEFRRADITDKATIKPIFKEFKIEYILHPAAIFKFSAPKELLQLVNVTGTHNLLDVATSISDIKATVIFGTAMAYGKHEGEINEDVELKPQNPYAISKKGEEEAANEFSDKCKIIIVRPTAMYGSRQKYGLKKIIDILANDYPVLPLPYMGEVKNSIVHVRDVAESAIYLISNYDKLPYNVFNIADLRQVTLYEAFNLIKKITLSKTIPLPLSDFISKQLEIMLEVIPSTLEFPLYHPFKFKKVVKLEPDDFVTLFHSNIFSSERLIKAGYKFIYPTIEVGLPKTIDHLIENAELPPKTIERIKLSKK